MSTQLSIASIPVRQFNQLYSLNDLHIASGADKKHQPALFLRNTQTKELIYEIERSTNSQNAIITKRGGDFQGTFGCKEIVYAYAMWISPSFMLKVIRAYDDMYGSYLPNTINPEQQQAIKQAVNERSFRTGEHYQAIYTKLYDQFKIPRYQDLPSSKFNEAIKFLGGVSSPSKLSDEDLYDLAWLYKVADRMRYQIELIVPALNTLGASCHGEFYSMAHDYKTTLRYAKVVLERETAHINDKGLTNKWNNVLPVIRNKPRNKVINFQADIAYLD